MDPKKQRNKTKNNKKNTQNCEETEACGSGWENYAVQVYDDTIQSSTFFYCLYLMDSMGFRF